MRSPTRSTAATWTRWSTSRRSPLRSFYARMAEEAGHFTLADVLARISDKLERRHLHIFGDADEGGHHLWEVIAEERAKLRSRAPSPASPWPFRRWSAQPSCRNAARTGFDWPDIEGPKAKIREELDEIAAAPPEELEEEVGDLLRGRQLRTLSQDRTGRGAEESEPEVRAALPCNREGASASPR